MSSVTPDTLYYQLPAFTLDRPLGIHLWPLLDKAFTATVGYAPNEFQIIPSKTPLATTKSTLAFIAIYYTIIFSGRELMRGRAPFKLNFLFLTHNLCLTIVSTFLLLLYIEQLVPMIARHGIFSAVCQLDVGWTKPIVVLHYLNYLTKYIELLDTVFLFLKKKPLTFLHCYHHGATVFMVSTAIVHTSPVTWVISVLNLAVHVLMYWYYFQTARNVRIWWKHWITRLQIIQFIIDLGFTYFVTYNYITSTYFPWMPYIGSCATDSYMIVVGNSILSSYLVLFVLFYFAAYRKLGSKPTSHKAKHIPFTALVSTNRLQTDSPTVLQKKQC
ncbi:Putative elongation of fatty acids protein 1 [Cladobotryum mycophilum]|uniref:Elongation of fatty acids protein n=1 Tax=Cladobotryum mycophilum TaxID=491253 RepID=A0ABR0S8C8_9HYPO